MMTDDQKFAIMLVAAEIELNKLERDITELRNRKSSLETTRANAAARLEKTVGINVPRKVWIVDSHTAVIAEHGTLPREAAVVRVVQVQ